MNVLILLVLKEKLDKLQTIFPSGCHKFTLRDQIVKLNFKDMVLHTEENQKLCDVRRRPMLRRPAVQLKYVNRDRLTHSQSLVIIELVYKVLYFKHLVNVLYRS